MIGISLEFDINLNIYIYLEFIESNSYYTDLWNMVLWI